MRYFRPRTFGELVRVVWRRKSIITTLAAVILIATFLTVKKLPDIYESRATIVVANETSDNAAFINSQVTAATQQIVSQLNLERIIRKYQLYPALNLTEA